ncbi:MAG: hypothetical protein GWP61_11865 [Chloroflexi bacterium]|jgi:hypothetical protein|nr:hypothetical protein [Chloroflexota bacterium]
MNEEYTILLHDLLILEEMAANMAAYLDSDVKQWTIPRANMPRLTIGGYLMRQQRLKALQDRLQPDAHARYWVAVQKFDEALVERIVRFEVRANQELHTRIAEWVNYLRDLGGHVANEANYYAGIVDTRVVINSLINQLQKRPYQLDQGVLEEVESLDNNLRLRLEGHEFIWEGVWKPAYPPEESWWLYGYPRRIESSASKR